ncbi:bifunctional UDP-N-acetylmuramoyl-tripeptide:D-alanyl-D-alanine ligase/alanine racemase [Carboxylicivirga sp. M1479]|uniref:bifunctional UDP-N-acetylmuramoyl-tripeptide:D-alanyl-D-alanine ligase/alanine racemase n=1 Tax=Carboxylicivirga sp. M1479 TaxID=2594476 RepID=UPI0011785BC1|nr:bifunctional UDP-N-acetylmuramoyl-tripeptide:D-alanyl-D-alanine ligase/alanine racemase [Carboxylicivirga sp. M1479]TRX70234.1 bifunctional UDP-N-acetylmuramoyl-tripeptide:D-alanyl-D-alanine ligase/alanine racemase [Carboxylicivirga sp. M1479]
MIYTIQQLAAWSNAELRGIGTLEIERLVYDSRKTIIPEKTVFVAIKSSSNNGHDYIYELYQKGVRCFIVESDQSIDYGYYSEAGFVVCDNSNDCLQKIAAEIRQSFNIPFIAITGSNGKTIVKEWLNKVLESNHKTGRSPRSYNSQIGVPLSIWMLAKDIDYAIVEAGISQPGEMERIAHCIKPTHGVLTNLGQAHQENFQSLQQKLDEKLLLFQSAHTIFYHGDNELVNASVTKQYAHKKLLSCGYKSHNSLQLLVVKKEESGSTLELLWQQTKFSITVPFHDEISFDNVLLVILCALDLGMTVEQLRRELLLLAPMAMRLEQKEGINNCLLIDDGYSADLTSLELALDSLNQMGSKRGLSKTLILSDIVQSGKTTHEWYQSVVKLLEEKGVSKLIGIGPQLHSVMKGENAFESTDAFLREFDGNSFQSEAILIKGARQFTFEQISAVLELQRHKTVMEINLNALAHNVKYFRSKLLPETKLLAMVKAFSYGTGSFEIANLLAHQKVDYLGVAFADEGIELRKAGITLPIIVMNPELNSFPLMLDYELEPEVYSFEVLDAYLKAVQRQGYSRVPIHIKVDTGMNRLGFLPDELSRLLEVLKQSSDLYVSSVFTHLAGSDEAVHDKFTSQQLSRFNAACSQLNNGLGYSFIRHALNSAGIERFVDQQMDMVRLGIGMYGVSALADENLQQVTTLRSYVSQLKTVKAGETVGYSRKGKYAKDMLIGVIPIGYADGFNRQLSNGVGHVIINGRKASVVGNVCMDMCMVDVSNIPVKEGDEVEVFGSHLTISALAKTLKTIPYEILTSISRRVKRVYVME